MIQPNKKFKKEDSLLFHSWNGSLWYLENEIIALLILSGLYEKNIITLDKLKGQLTSLKNGTLLRHKGTYHCTINNRWYTDEPINVILRELFEEYKLNSINISNLIEVIQLYLNKNYNYCLDFILSNIYPKLLNSFGYAFQTYDYLNQYIDTKIDNFPKIKHKGYKSECYECGNEHFECNHRQTVEQIEDIINFFHQYKKGNLNKIPKQTI